MDGPDTISGRGGRCLSLPATGRPCDRLRTLGGRELAGTFGYPLDGSDTGVAVRLTLEGSAGGLGDIGGALYPVGNRHPVILGNRLDEIPQAFVLADGDGEAHVQLAADGYHTMSVEAAVGPHRELHPCSTVAHPPHRLPQEVDGAAGGVGPAWGLAQVQMLGEGGRKDQPGIVDQAVVVEGDLNAVGVAAW